MMWWVFTDAAAAQTAQDDAFKALPPDTLFSGQPSPVQYTKRWADILPLTDGSFAFQEKIGLSKPLPATVSADISAKRPVEQTTLDGDSKEVAAVVVLDKPGESAPLK